MTSVPVAAVVGLGLGAATGIPLGVVNLTIVEAAARAGRRHATWIGVGGAIADTIHSGLAFVGIAPALEQHPDATKALAAISAAIVIAYAIAVVRRAKGAQRSAPARDHAGVLIGLALTLPNPAPLAAWIAVAGALLPGVSPAAGVAAALGVGVGSAVWFALLARIAERGRSSALVTRWLPRVAAVVFVAIAILAVVRAWR